jgi:two-component system NtrC family response regulator
MKVGNILVIEDDESLRRVMQVQLENSGYKTAVAGDVPEALEILRLEPQDIVITDLNLPGMSGLDLLKKIRAEYPETITVMITAFGTVASAVDAMKAGAYDYLTKPVHPYELKALIGRVLEKQRLLDEVRTLRSSIDVKFGFEKITGRSPRLMHALDSAARVAQTDATVLIRGETGTGKELLAKAIHLNSPRRDRAFATINCGAIPRDLLESELFGHVKGAFTGALTHKKGKIEEADHGTVFLDEIGEMPLELQVRVLRLIQDREIEKVGSPHSIHIDVRVIAATHRNLEDMVERGAFREDLYYRLLVVPIELPPLRARSDDIPDLICEFFKQSTTKYDRKDLTFSHDLLVYFSQYQWPGNIRQLQNLIERIVVLCPRNEITLEDLPDFLRHGAASATAVSMIPNNMTLEAVERAIIQRALEQSNWNQSRAAQQLGITRKILMSRTAKYRIEKQDPTHSNPDSSQSNPPLHSAGSERAARNQ